MIFETVCGLLLHQILMTVIRRSDAIRAVVVNEETMKLAEGVKVEKGKPVQKDNSLLTA